MVKIPRTWRVCTNKTILDIVDEVYNCYKDNGYNFSKPKIYTNKSTVSFGWCHYDSKGKEFAISLNEKYLQEPEKSYSTIIHELAHCAVPKRGHDRAWYCCANIIGKIYGIEINCTDDEGGNEIEISTKPNYKYEVKCPTCGRSWKYERMGKVVKYATQCKCPYCDCGLISRYI